MAVERREKDGGGGRGGKDRNLNLVDVYDIAADIGKVRDLIMGMMVLVKMIMVITVIMVIMGMVMVRMRKYSVWSMFTTLLSILGR